MEHTPSSSKSTDNFCCDNHTQNLPRSTESGFCSKDKNDDIRKEDLIKSCLKNMPNEAKATYEEHLKEVQDIKEEDLIKQCLKNMPDEGKASYEEYLKEVQDINEGDLIKSCLKNIPDEDKSTYEEYLKEVQSLASVPILKSVTEEHILNFKPYNYRYFEDRYVINNNVNEIVYCDIMVRIHTNKLLLIALGSGNHIIRNNKEVVSINFVINNRDRSNIKLKGKKKNGSQTIGSNSILCQVQCKDEDHTYNIRAGIAGRIIEINELLKKQPDLIRTGPKEFGFIAVVFPKCSPGEFDDFVKKSELLTEDEYIKYLVERPPSYQAATNLC